MPRDRSNPFVTVAGRSRPRALVRTGEGQATVRVEFDGDDEVWADLTFTRAQLEALLAAAGEALPPPARVEIAAACRRLLDESEAIGTADNLADPEADEARQKAIGAALEALQARCSHPVTSWWTTVPSVLTERQVCEDCEAELNRRLRAMPIMDLKILLICEVCGAVEGRPHKQDCPLDPKTGGDRAADANRP